MPRKSIRGKRRRHDGFDLKDIKSGLSSAGSAIKSGASSIGSSVSSAGKYLSDKASKEKAKFDKSNEITKKYKSIIDKEKDDVKYNEKVDFIKKYEQLQKDLEKANKTVEDKKTKVNDLQNKLQVANVELENAIKDQKDKQSKVDTDLSTYSSSKTVINQTDAKIKQKEGERDREIIQEKKKIDEQKDGKRRRKSKKKSVRKSKRKSDGKRRRKSKKSVRKSKRKSDGGFLSLFKF